MDKPLLKKVCKYLRTQKDNEAFFATFWDKTKDLYPEGLSKAQVKKSLQEHTELFEIIAGKDGNPVSKIRLKVVEAVQDGGPSTTPAEDEEIISKLVEAIETEATGLLFANICARKVELFPSKLQKKKAIRKWLEEHSEYFEMLTDQNGGLRSVQITQRARQKKKGGTSRSKRKPKPKENEDVVVVDRVRETRKALEKVTHFLHCKGGSVSFESLVQQKGIFPEGVRGNDSVRCFLANYPSRFQVVYDLMSGEVVVRNKSDPVQSAPISCNPSRQISQSGGVQDVDKVVNFICENGGIVSYAALLRQAGSLIDESIVNNEALFLWLSSNSDTLEILPTASGSNSYGQVKVKLNFVPRFCQGYVGEKHCTKEDCAYLHICKAFLCGRCSSSNICQQSHNIRDKHNKAIVHKSKVLRKCADQVINKVLLKSCFPRICTEFNKNKQGQCPRGENCNFLHVCGDYVLNQCSGSCPLSHNAVDGLHNIQLLKKYALLPSKKMTIEMVKTNIAYVQVQKLDVTSGNAPSTFQNDCQQRKMSETSSYSKSLFEKEEEKKSRSRPRKAKKVTPSSLDNTDSGQVNSDCSDSESDGASSNKNAPPSILRPSLFLNLENIRKSCLSSSLLGDQKVESWMSSTTGDYSGKFDGPMRERSESLSSSGESVQSSISSSHNSFQLTEIEKKVFRELLDKYGGSARFQEITKDPTLLPPKTDAQKWFKDHPNSFIIKYNGRGQVERVDAFSRSCRVCLDYSKSGKICTQKNCRFFHVCRDLVESRCQNGAACKFNHSFKSKKVKQLAKRFHLEELTGEQLCRLMQLSTPNVCSFHNRGHCNMGDNCPDVHICKKFVKGKCQAKSGCKFGHLDALEKEPAKKLLEQYGMAKQKPWYICKMLLVISQKTSTRPADSTEVDSRKTDPATRDSAGKTGLPKSDSKGKTRTEAEVPKICSLFLTGQSHSKKCQDFHHGMPYLWQFRVGNPSAKWCKFDDCDSENIEKMFCDVNCKGAELNLATKITKQSKPHSSVRLDFQAMSGSTEPSSDDGAPIEFYVRRLESSVQNTTGHGEWFEAQWMWYKLDDSHKWKKLEENKVCALEESYLEGAIQIDPSSRRRRPAIFLTQSEVQEEKERLTIEANVPEPPSPVIAEGTDPQAHVHVNSGVTSSSPAVHRVRVESGTQDYHTIEKLLHSSIGEVQLKINQLEKIRNETLWSKYKGKKKQMTDDLLPGESVNEKHLFMPCRHDDVERVMQDNVHLSRLDVPQVLGPGHYFTSDASLCLDWCTTNSTQSRFLLVCQVLVGTYTQGSANTTSFPRRHDSRYYDSLVNNTADPVVFVVPCVDQCYPAFIIEFSFAAREKALPSPTVPSYHCVPVSSDPVQRSVARSVVSHPLSQSVVPDQQLCSATRSTSAGGFPEFGVPQSPVLSPNATASTGEEYVKAPPPYSERPFSISSAVPSPMPPTYYETMQPVSGQPQIASAYRQPGSELPQSPNAYAHLQSNHGQPATVYSQPESGYRQPATTLHQPVNTYAQPGSSHPHLDPVPLQATNRRAQSGASKDKDCVVM